MSSNGFLKWRREQDFAQQWQGDRALLFERIAVERSEQAGEAAHVARRTGQQVSECFLRQRQRPGGGLRFQRGNLFAVAQRVEAIDQARTEPCAQILA